MDNPNDVMPMTKSTVEGYELELPEFWKDCKALDQVIEVDYYLPGCPPPTPLVAEAIDAILKGALPPKGSVLAPEKSLCNTCRLNETKPETMVIEEFKRYATSTPDPETCFLAQGYVCMGPATRSGCGELCINANMPCRGCLGPTPDVVDAGVKMLSTLGTIGIGETEEQAAALADTLADPAGTLYRFSVASSLLRRTVLPERGKK